MRSYRFLPESVLPERLVRDPVVQELVRIISPQEIVAALATMGFTPSDASLAAGALLRQATNGMSMPYEDEVENSAGLDHDLEKLAQHQAMQPGKDLSQKGQLETFAMGASDAPISTFLFPGEEEEDEDWPYDDATKGIMNAPLTLGPRMST